MKLFTNPKIPLCDQLATDLTQNRSRAQKRFITGPPGCGKSTTLHRSIYLCTKLGWIVFHIPDCVDLCSLNREEASKKILNYQVDLYPWSFNNVFLPNRVNRNNVSFEQFIQTGIFNNRCEETLQEVIAELCQFRSKRVLFAFDNWNNLLLRLHTNNTAPNTIATSIANWFTFDVSNGFALAQRRLFRPFRMYTKIIFPELLP